MTGLEALDKVLDICEELKEEAKLRNLPDVFLGVSRVAMAVKGLIKGLILEEENEEDEYRWHNLRENPDDLPVELSRRMTYKEAIDTIMYTPLMRLETEHGELKEALTMAVESLEYVGEMQEFALNTSDDFYGEVLCRKLEKHGFLVHKNGYYEVEE